MAKTELKEARKDKIIDAALKVFARKDFTDVNVADISKEAGVSTPVLYEYFKTKEEMLFAIPEKYSKEPIDLLEKVLPYLKGVEAKIRAIIYGYLSIYQESPLYSSIVILQLKGSRKFLETDIYRKIRNVAGILLSCIKEGIADGTFKSNTDPLLIRSMILGTIEHLCTRKLLVDDSMNLLSYVDTIMDSIINGIVSQPTRISLDLSINNIDEIRNIITNDVIEED